MVKSELYEMAIPAMAVCSMELGIVNIVTKLLTDLDDDTYLDGAFQSLLSLKHRTL